MISKLNLLMAEFRERGLAHGLKRIILFLFRPITGLIKRSGFMIELFYGIFPKAIFLIPFHPVSSGLVNFPQTELVKAVRKFWHSNILGQFDFGGEKIARYEIFLYGGPNPKFSCPICQKSEWLSRVRQKNLFASHSCQSAKECEILCGRQGNELWTHIHQNFDFSAGCDSELPSPKCLAVIHREKESFFAPSCDIFVLIFRRQLSFVCQVDVVERPVKINWPNYDFLLIVNDGSIRKFPRPAIPVVMIGYDYWPIKDKGRQRAIDWLKPDIFLTPDPTPWKENFKMPPETKVVFYPLFDSLFFARPQLAKKELDLLVLGATTSSSVYQPRIVLNKQISRLSASYKIEFSHSAGDGNVSRKGAILREDSRTGSAIRFLNKWSEYLSSARYAIFGRMKYPGFAIKHYEILGSGAVPIFPETPDFKYLGIKPFEHYIPLSEVEGNNEKLSYYLDNYDKYKRIARNAVNWYKENSDRMIFRDFEETIREITNYKYPRRLI